MKTKKALIIIIAFILPSICSACNWGLFSSADSRVKIYTTQNSYQLSLSKEASSHIDNGTIVQYYNDIRAITDTDSQAMEYVLEGFSTILSDLHRKYDDVGQLSQILFDKNNYNTPFAISEGKNPIIFDDTLAIHDTLNKLQQRIYNITIAEQTVEGQSQLEDNLNRTKLRCEFSTKYNLQDKNRSNNIALATSSINGTIIKAGETFSYNQVVGERTEDRGYQTAKIIFDGAFTQGVGGGVCQVSSTLYNTALLSGLDVTVRVPHSMPISYVPLGRDAMVSSLQDLQFTNNTPSDIYIVGKTENGSIYFKMYGLELDTKIELEQKVRVIENDVEYVDGEVDGQVIKEGGNGYNVITLAKLTHKDNRTEIKQIAVSYYAPRKKIVTAKKLPFSI